VEKMEIRQVKEEIRILGIDDARFRRGVDEWTRLVGVVFRGGKWMEGCMQIPIQVDSNDATDQLVSMVNASPHHGQLRVIMTADTIFAGVNVIDLPRVVAQTGLPVIAVSDNEPDMNRVTKAFQRICPDRWQEKLAILSEAGPIRAIKSHPDRVPIFIQWAGLPFEQAVELVQKTATHSRLPEPVRVAHLFASSFVPDE
jgi:endonuclease V-like protein UPF0215 family